MKTILSSKSKTTLSSVSKTLMVSWVYYPPFCKSTIFEKKLDGTRKSITGHLATGSLTKGFTQPQILLYSINNEISPI